ncbi:MAG TPA: carbohydrate binding domain-containing protein, partial [Terriglobales bacterium]|nr:carbohydrate binding domain-containing protein [Terriglobales bacterium]
MPALVRTQGSHHLHISSNSLISQLRNVALLAVYILITSAAFAETVVQNDFEDGTLQGWISRGTAILTNTTEAAHGGAHSLKTTNRTAPWNGPSLNLTSSLKSGNIYQVTAWVRLVAGQSADTLAITVQRTDNGTNFDRVATSATAGVTDSNWVMLQGTYSFAGNPTGLLLYIESAGSTTQYYVDDFSVVQVPAAGCSDPPDNSGFSNNFEDGTAQGWVSRGGGAPVVVTPTMVDAHTGNWSVLVTGRTATWNGPTHNITGKMCNGSQYWLEAWVKMAPGQPTTTMNMSLQYTDLAGAVHYPPVVTATVTSGAWVRLKAKPYTFSGSYTNLQIYIQSYNNPTASFY